MEIPVLAERAGTVTAIKVTAGDVVQEGDPLVVLDEERATRAGPRAAQWAHVDPRCCPGARSGPRARTRSDPRPLSIGELELDLPGRGELLVRIEAAGLCHSDLSVVDGNRVRPVPMLLGHEAAGRVVEAGGGETPVAVASRVVMTFLPRCGSARPAPPTAAP